MDIVEEAERIAEDAFRRAVLRQLLSDWRWYARILRQVDAATVGSKEWHTANNFKYEAERKISQRYGTTTILTRFKRAIGRTYGLNTTF